VVNGVYIYSLVREKPIVIDIPANPSRVVVTDGFHITRPLELVYSTKRTYYFKVVCAIEDEQLLVGFVLIVILFAMGTTSGILLLRLLSLVPVLYFLFLYYINRKEFIQIRPA
jgi:hypothetical protein